MPKTVVENLYLSKINTNLTDQGDAVHADMWIGGYVPDDLDHTHNSDNWRWVDGKVIERR